MTINHLQPREQEPVETGQNSVSGASERQVGKSGQPFSETRTTGPENGEEPDEYIAPGLRAFAFPVALLQAAPDNARQHGERDLASLAESLRRHGQQKLAVGKWEYRDLSRVVICGSGMLQATRLLGRSHIAVTWFEGTDDEAREYAIRDNRTSDLSRFDNHQLAALQTDGVDLLSLGWTGAELGDLLALAEPQVVPQFAPVDAEHRLDQLQPHCRTCTCRQRSDSR